MVLDEIERERIKGTWVRCSKKGGEGLGIKGTRREKEGRNGEKKYKKKKGGVVE